MVDSQFDDLAMLYERFSEQPFRRELEFPSVLEAVGEAAGLRVLDLGCGSGVYSRKLARGGAEVTGLDVAGGMIDYAVRREREEPLGVGYVPGALPPDLYEIFDVVLGVYVLPYVTTYEELVDLCRSAVQALRPGGRFVTLPIHPGFHRDPAYYAPYGFRLHAYEPEDGAAVVLNLWAGRYEATITARYWTGQTLERALAEAGYTRVDWLPHVVSEHGAREYGTGYWQPYLTVPHAALLDCRKQEVNP
ncbi:class I SAM-dependent methyltransferase [Actinomadura sp. KC06]|uniref:class I SAM-dependent methyltransferase n=1 Tax=Actinomadura sp. KC06 TaxID=2530369 RepID=UPI00104A77BD|nr:class I SAM-dependent methyltransferase [Actinomadura sp. KC06]TDD29604.1 class I SAM-dependent methyltransferase [Actinomadura sp. KC06]